MTFIPHFLNPKGEPVFSTKTALEPLKGSQGNDTIMTLVSEAPLQPS